jgi:PLP dependent protein
LCLSAFVANMSINTIKYQEILKKLNGKATLVAVSKIRTVEEIMQLYRLGQRDFGENYVQELVYKQERLPQDINWHFIGHLQSNKVKYIAPFIYLIQGVDSFNLLKEINKQALKNNRIIDCLLQVHISKEETKFGLDEKELHELFKLQQLHELKNVRITGLMGMASFTEDNNLIIEEFTHLKKLFDRYTQPPAGSFGQTTNHKLVTLGLALEAGSNMVRIGSMLFGSRIKPG